MTATTNRLTKVPENKFIGLMNEFREIDQADIVTAVRDVDGTFTVDSTVLGDGNRTAITLTGKMSFFGGPDDMGVTPDEGLSLFGPDDVAGNPELFLPTQPPGTTGLARRLDPTAKYIACRWDFAITPKNVLRTMAVKVTNPANGKTAMARPVDFGPSLSTGRVTDLSPAFEQALGLKTDQTCIVEIPVPETGISAGVDLEAIDSSLFAADMTRDLVVMTTSNNTIYWVSNLSGEDEAGQSLMRRVGANPAEILRSDSTVFPVLPTDQIPETVAGELNKAAPASAGEVAEGPPPAPGSDIAALVFGKARAFVGHSTAGVPGTNHGNLACAWAVNEVVRQALGRPISGKKSNGLATSEMFDVLKAHHSEITEAQAKAGHVVISPTVGRNVGHVGIVGNPPDIFSNSSSHKRFEKNYTLEKWKSRFLGKGLDVKFFALNADQFGASG